MKAKYRGIELEINSKEDFDLLFSSVDKSEFRNDGRQIVVVPTKTEAWGSSAPIKSKKHKTWSKADDKFLASNNGTLGIRVMAKMLGRTMGAVKAHMHSMRHVSATPKPRSVGKSIPVSIKSRGGSKSNEILQLLTQGKTHEYIVSATGCTRRQVYDVAYSAKKKGMLTPAQYKSGIKDDQDQVRGNVISLLANGASYDEVVRSTGLGVKQIYNIAYNARQAGLLKPTEYKSAKRNKTGLPNKIVEVLKPSISNATFSMVAKDKIEVARSMISSCAKSKSRITIADCDTFFGLSIGESKAFMIDVFQQQKKLGYKVIIDSDRLIFQ